MNSLLRTGSSWVRRTGIPGVTQTRSVSKQVIILGVPKHVTEQMVEHRARDYGDLNDVPTFRGKDVRNVNINFRELSSAMSMVDELHRTMLWGHRLDIVFRR